MRQPDRPEPGKFNTRPGNLAERLARLPDRHPSSPARDSADESGYPAEQADAEAGPGDETELADAEEPGQDETAENSLDGGRTAGRRPAASGTPDRGRRSGQGPYRPWFADGGPADPWFAAGLEPDSATPGG